jgi:hypothetical protein
MKALTASLMALMLCACASMRGEQGFAGAPGRSFILLGADGMAADGKRGFTFVFRKLDMKSAEFLKEDLRIEFSGSGPARGPEFAKPETLKTSLRFGGQQVTPGDYALISLVERASDLPGGVSATCFNDGAPVFHIVEGRINIIAAGNVAGPRGPSELRVEDEATQMLKSHPGYSAPAANTRAFGSVTFDITGARTTTGRAAAANCKALGRHQFKPRGRSQTARL